MYTRRVFVSHSWKYTEHYDKLASWIFDESWSINGTPIEFIDTSIPKNNPIHHANSDKELQEAIFGRIEQSDVVVCPTGMYSQYSKWIAKEVGGASLNGVKLLAVNPWAQERKSSAVQEAADRIVGWNKKSIINAVWQLGNS